MSQSFSNTTAVVTGASSGIGRAVAVALAGAGVRRLVIHYRRHEAGARETAELLKPLGCHASVVAADLADECDTARLVEYAFEELGTIHTWVNNAGADVLTGGAKEWDFDTKLRTLLDVDVVGTIRLSRLVSLRLLQQKLSQPPAMVFIGWDQSQQGMEGEAGQLFAPVKAAVTAFATSLAQELAAHVRVNTIAPGWIQTSWGQSTSEYWDRRAREQSLMHRWGRPEDVAQAVLFVADPANTFIQAETIRVGGGWNRRFDK